MDIRGRKMKKPPACVQCRRRKIGCDRVKPVCGNCQKTGKADCFFPDIPGQYVQSTPSSSTRVPLSGSVSGSPAAITPGRHTNSNMVANGSNGGVSGSVSNFHSVRVVDRPQKHSHHHSSKETLGTGNSNSTDLASLEQIREYNTRLQLLSAQEHRFSPSVSEFAQHNNKEAPRMGNSDPSSYNSTSAFGDMLNYNLVEGSAVFDLVTSLYTQEEVLLKEMDFLVSRLADLKQVSIKKFGSNIVQWSAATKNNTENSASKRKSPENEENSDVSEKKIKVASYNSIEDIISSGYDSIMLPSGMLDKSKMLTVLEPKNIDSIQELSVMRDIPNCFFDSKYLINRDSYLLQFCCKLSSIATEKFGEDVIQWGLQKNVRHPRLPLERFIKFPSRAITSEIIDLYSVLLPDSKYFIPFLNADDLLQSVKQLFGRETKFVPKQIDVDTLVILGTITVCLLLLHSSLSAIPATLLTKAQKSALHELIVSLRSLRANVYIILSEIDRRKYLMNDSWKVLQFVALWKYYEDVIYQPFSIRIEYDEDMIMAREMALNNAKSGSNALLLWNFIYKNYCLRHIFKGETPDYTSYPELNSGIIVNPLLQQDLKFLKQEIQLVQYLNTADNIITLPILNDLKNLLSLKLNEQVRLCDSETSVLNFDLDALLYRNSIVHLDYFLLMQYEKNKNNTEFITGYQAFIQIVKEVLQVIFSTIPKATFAGYTFLFTNKSFALLDSICLMLLALAERHRLAFKTSPIVLKELDSLQAVINEHYEIYQVIFQNLKYAIESYKSSLQVKSAIVTKIDNTLSTILEYFSLCKIDAESHGRTQTNQNLMFGTPNAFENVGSSELSKITPLLQSLSDVLPAATQSDALTQDGNGYEAKSPDTLGLTKENFNEIYDSFFA